VTGILTAGAADSITVTGPSGDVTAAPAVNLAVTGDPQPGQPATMEGTTSPATGELVATSLSDPCDTDATASPTDDAASPTDTTASPTDSTTPTETDGAADQSPEATDDADDDDADELDGEDDCNRGSGQSGDLRSHSNSGGVHIQRGTVVSFSDDTLVVLTESGEVTVLITEDTGVKGDPSLAMEVKVRGDLDDGVVIADEVKVLCPNAHGGDDDFEGDDVDDEDDDGDKDNSGSGEGNGSGGGRDDGNSGHGDGNGGGDDKDEDDDDSGKDD
jgi:hypothetical protein